MTERWRRWARLAPVGAMAALLAACAEGPRPGLEQPFEETGIASWYGSGHRATADGERFDANIASAAHRTLPMPCLIEVTNLDNGRSARLRVNDRGPFVAGRILDVSRRGAEELGFAGQGVAKVHLRYLGPAPGAAAAPASSSSPEGTQAETSARVQAGAFAERDNAERAARRLWPRGEVAIVGTSSGERTLWRVIVTGPEGESGAALRGAIIAQGFTDAKLLGP